MTLGGAPLTVTLLISVSVDRPRLPEECEVFNRFDACRDALEDVVERVGLEDEDFFCWSPSFLFDADSVILAILSSDISSGDCMGFSEPFEGREALEECGVDVENGLVEQPQFRELKTQVEE
jgi:hypothetical protein